MRGKEGERNRQRQRHREKETQKEDKISGSKHKTNLGINLE